jgi:hypothetical protein
LGKEGYGHVGPHGFRDGAFNSYIVYFRVVIIVLPFSIKIYIGTSGNGEDCAVGGEGIGLLRGALGFTVQVVVD